MFDAFNPLQDEEMRFTSEKLNEIIQWFDENSKPQLFINDELVNVVTVDKLQQWLALKKFHKRSFHYPSYGEIMKEAENLKAGVTKMLTKEQILDMLNKWIIEPDVKHELLLAFKVFDTEKRDFLELEELETIVTSYGDIFNKAETQELLRDANVHGDGNIFYEDFVQSLFNVAPELYEIKVEYLYNDPAEDPSVSPDPVTIEEEQVPPTPETDAPAAQTVKKKKKFNYK